MAKRITLSSLEAFIRNTLREKLKKDLSAFRIIREADIACCVYFHLRKFLLPDSAWMVFAERHSKTTGHFIDIVIFREDSKKRPSPRIALELKWNWNRIPKKDRASLNKCIKRLRLKKVYFISLCTKEGKHTITKTKREKFKLFEIYVRPDLQGQAYKEWQVKRNLIKEMS
jgi:hypothetical protein